MLDWLSASLLIKINVYGCIIKREKVKMVNLNAAWTTWQLSSVALIHPCIFYMQQETQEKTNDKNTRLILQVCFI